MSCRTSRRHFTSNSPAISLSTLANKAVQIPGVGETPASTLRALHRKKTPAKDTVARWRLVCCGPHRVLQDTLRQGKFVAICNVQAPVASSDVIFRHSAPGRDYGWNAD